MDPKFDTMPVDLVQLDAYVALKIIKYARESKLALSGALLGVKSGNSLMINNCYPLPKLSIAKEDLSSESDLALEVEKQREIGKKIMDNMQLISEDWINVGWYQSSLMGDYMNDDTLQGQYNLQKAYQHWVCIIFDISLANQSFKSFKAIRLTSFAMQSLAESKEEPGKVRLSGINLEHVGMKLESLFEEIPIVMHREHLLQEFLAQEIKIGDINMDSNILKIAPDMYLVNHMMHLNGYLADITQEQRKIIESKKRAKMKKREEDEGDHTNMYLLGNQVIASCKELKEFLHLTDLKQRTLMELDGVNKIQEEGRRNEKYDGL